MAGEPKSDDVSEQNRDRAPHHAAAGEATPAREPQGNQSPRDPSRGPHPSRGSGRPHEGNRGEGARSPREGGHRDRDARGHHDRGPRDHRGRDFAGGNRVSSDSPLTAGLFASVGDKAMPCRVKGCDRTWTWFASQQIRSFGQPAPQRMCEHHQQLLSDVQDREVPCRNAPSCSNTWLWKRGAQFALLERHPDAVLRPPSRVCESCLAEEKTTVDRSMPCRVSGCKETWNWTRQAQIQHRAWLRREQQKRHAHDHDGPSSHDAVEAEGGQVAADATTTGETQPASGKRNRRRRGGKQRRFEDVPQRMCRSCEVKFNHIEDLDLPCRVHGCQHSWRWSKVAQLRAWVLAGLPADQPPPRPKRMCMSCSDFCRQNSDRQMPCANSDCANTWLYKTGTQLQRFVAGESVDEVSRLCTSCAAAQAAAAPPQIEGEPMPCLTTGCTGTWLYYDGMELLPYDDTAVEPPDDRICDACRTARQLPPRYAHLQASANPLDEAVAAEMAALQGEDSDEIEDDAELAQAHESTILEDPSAPVEGSDDGDAPSDEPSDEQGAPAEASTSEPMAD